MRVRHRAAGAERTVEVEQCLDGFTVADLAAALLAGPGIEGSDAEGSDVEGADAEAAGASGAGAGASGAGAGGAEGAGADGPDFVDGGGEPLGLRIDGCWHGPETPLSSVRIWEGALLEIAPNAPEEQAPSQSAAAEGGRPPRFLAVTAGLRAGKRFAVPSSGAWVIGRAESCDLVLDDPAVSRRHARITVRPGDGRLSIVDLASRNGTIVAGRVVRGPVPVPVGSTVRLGATCLQWHTAVDDTPAAVRAGIGAAGGRIPFNRPPRRRPRMGPAPLRVPAQPPPRPEQEPLGWAGIVLPVVAGLVLALVWSPFMAVFAALGPVIAVGTWLERRRRAERKHEQACRRVDEAVSRLVRGLPAARAAERRRVVGLLPDLAELVRRAENLSVRCWERRLGDPDAMRLGAGVAEVAFSPPVEVDGGGDPAPAALDALQAVGPLEDVPVAVSLLPGEVVGIVGTAEVARAVARALVLQAAVLHGPADLAVVGLVPGRAEDWSWMRWLPHAADAAGGGAGSLVATEAEAVPAAAETAATERSPRVKLTLIDGTGPLTGRNAPGRTVLDLPTASGIVVARESCDLPAACTTIIEVRHDAGRVKLVDPRSAAALEPVIAWGVTVSTATDVAACLARLDDPDLDAAGTNLPGLVSLVDLVGEPTPERVLRRWATARGTADLKAPVGTACDGPLELDLVADGPHLLVGGTTGSGKSELLRSLVAGLAMSADPDHLAFVLVDYKGGAAFDRCSDMPHVAGMVTDLDDRLAERALVCLEAELRHREERLRAVGAEDLSAFRARCSKLPGGSEAPDPLPRLVVVVDEFATLAAELPEFLKSLVGIAQRGRSLGVHMVLATQRPAGVVTEDIRANTSCRIALRVTDRHDSNDVIGAPDAARIPRQRPGRALARFGPGELIAFQSALVTGVTAPVEAGLRTRPVGDWSPVPGVGNCPLTALSADAGTVPSRWSPVRARVCGAGSDSGAESRSPESDGSGRSSDSSGLSGLRRRNADAPLSANLPGPAAEGRNDLDRVVEGVEAAHERWGGRRPRSPWPEPLPGRIAADALARMADPGEPAAWLVDDPARQRQFVGGWDIDDGHLVALGGPRSGTSTTLAATALDLCRTWSPDDLHLYAIDLDSGLLSVLEVLPHVGAAIPPADGERRIRVLRLLDEEVAARRADTAGRTRPEIVLIVDDFAGLSRSHDPVRDTEPHERFARIWSDGPAVGVRASVSIGRAADLPPDLAASAGVVLVHAASDASDALRFGLRASTAGLGPGRAVRADDGREVQVGLPGGCDRDVTAAATAVAAACPPPRRRAPPIASLPEVVTDDRLPVGAVVEERRVLVRFAMSDLTLSPCGFALHNGEHALVLGPPRTGRTSALVAVAAAARRADIEVTVVAEGPSELSAWLGTAAVSAKDLGHKAQPRRLLLVDDADRVDDPTGVLARIAADGDGGSHIVAATTADRMRSSYGHWLAEIRASRAGVLFRPGPLDGDLLGAALPARLALPPLPGRGLIVADGEAAVAQVALAAQAVPGLDDP